MSDSAGNIELDLSQLAESVGGDMSFVALLLMKMMANLPASITEMEEGLAGEDWERLRSAVHKVKNTLAYLGLEELKVKYKDIENDIREDKDLDTMPSRVGEAVEQARKVLELVQAEHAKIA